MHGPLAAENDLLAAMKHILVNPGSSEFAFIEIELK
jgi:hypothetical protein